MRKSWLFLPVLLCAFTLAAEKIDWEQVPELRPGVRLLKLEREEPRLMKINLMRIDLKLPGLEFTGSARDADWGKPMPDYPQKPIRTKRIRTRDFMLVANGVLVISIFVALCNLVVDILYGIIDPRTR